MEMATRGEPVKLGLEILHAVEPSPESASLLFDSADSHTSKGSLRASIFMRFGKYGVLERQGDVRGDCFMFQWLRLRKEEGPLSLSPAARLLSLLASCLPTCASRLSTS